MYVYVILAESLSEEEGWPLWISNIVIILLLWNFQTENSVVFLKESEMNLSKVRVLLLFSH